MAFSIQLVRSSWGRGVSILRRGDRAGGLTDMFSIRYRMYSIRHSMDIVRIASVSVKQSSGKKIQFNRP